MANTQIRRFLFFFCKRVINSFYLEPANVLGVKNIISSLNPRKSLGVDDIPAKPIKAAKHVLSPYLSKLINYCLINGRSFDELKTARAAPFRKEGSKSDLQKTIAQ